DAKTDTETESAETEDDPGRGADPLAEESPVVLRAKGLDAGPAERQLRYTAAEGSGVQAASTMSRAQRRHHARHPRGGAAEGAAHDKVQDKPEGAPQGAGPNRAQRRKKRRKR